MFALAAVGALATAGYAGMTNFLAFHVVAEGITIIIAFSIVFIVLNTYDNLKDDFIPLIGIAYAFAGCFDVAHMLTYTGMAVFPEAGNDLPAQLWVIARYLDSTGMLLAGIAIGRGWRHSYVLAGYAAAAAAAALALYKGVFPVAFVDGQGLTLFKIYSEYVVSAVLTASVLVLIGQREHFGPRVYRPLLAFFAVSVATELSLTMYKFGGDLVNVIGHLLKVTAFFFLYRAVVATSLREPYERMNEKARELAAANRRLTETLASISDGLFILDNDWRVVYANPAAIERYGFKGFEGELGRSLWDIYPDAQPFYDQYHKAKRENAAVYFEAVSPDTGRWVEVHAYPAPEGLSVYIRDIGERRIFEAELARLDRLNTVGELAAGIGHEIRNPLTTVRGYLQLFANKEKYAEHREQFATMIEELDRANAIISEYLSLARTKAAEPGQGDLNGVLKALYPLLEADAARAGHSLELSTGDIPAVRFDEREIRQLVLNLARNGLEAMEPGGRLTISTFCDRGGAVLAVGDSGGGIPQEVLDKLGTPFMTTKEHGTGLGLAVCRRIADRHGAKLEVTTSSAGTTFFLRFGRNDFAGRGDAAERFLSTS
ncbi:MAG: MASE3 domain-containing protein [Sporomusaceae bacterium]|nr:MASE3 domain-containing protein [Sporomusaceae bacterium]